MALTNWKNLPDTSTPLNAENLNNNFDEMHPIGNIYITSTNENPSSQFGGTWELIDKEFKNQYFSNPDGISTLSGNGTALNIYAHTAGHSITIYMSFSANVAIGDTTVEIGKINYNKLGITRTPVNFNGLIGSSDAGNGIVMINLSTSGELTTVDAVTKTSGGSIPENNFILACFTTNSRLSEMLDEYCDKFYWKRVS